MNKLNVFCFGFGQVAENFVKKLKTEKIPFQLTTTSREETKSKNFEDINYQIEDDVMAKFKAGDTNKLKLDYMIKHYNNVVKQIDVKWRVIK